MNSAIVELQKCGNLVAQTKVLETRPILVKNQPVFLNQGILLETPLSAEELFAACQRIEIDLGRIQRVKNGPREIDIDLVWSSEGVIDEKHLKIPHRYNRAREWVRRFVAELKGDSVDSETGILLKKFEVTAMMNAADFTKKKKSGEKISMVTCYDYTFARLLARTSIDAVLVGDSLGNVIQGLPNTLGVTLDDMIYHARAVRRGLPQNFLVVDMPFMTYQQGVKEALENAARILRETFCDAVKLEGGAEMAPQIAALTQAGIPVMGHLGLTPQSVLGLGGYRVQARSDEAQIKLMNDAKAIEKAGAFAVVFEMVPRLVAQKIAKSLSIPVIGIGAGDQVDGQILVLTDLLGLDPDFSPKFLRKYANSAQVVIEAIERYLTDVREGTFPTKAESFES